MKCESQMIVTLASYENKITEQYTHSQNDNVYTMWINFYNMSSHQINTQIMKDTKTHKQ